jgi:hypothetical protein
VTTAGETVWSMSPREVGRRRRASADRVRKPSEPSLKPAQPLTSVVPPSWAVREELAALMSVSY